MYQKMVSLRLITKYYKLVIILIFFMYCCIITFKKNKNYVTPYTNFDNTDRHNIEPLPKDILKSIINCNDRTLKMETLRYSNYWLLKNYIRGTLSTDMECSESITYTTQSDYTFLGHLPLVAERWSAPISLALFAPGYDYNATMNAIQYVRNCLPESKLIRDYVSFHIYFPINHMPSVIAQNETEALAWPYSCQWKDIPYEFVKRKLMYKTRNNLTYPINVGRNIARKAVNTYFIFACDIELYPSLGLVDQFLSMVVEHAVEILLGDKPKVFPMPVFEMDEHALMPNSKQELQDMLKTTMAFPFHYKTCRNCHMVPYQDEWALEKDSERMSVFAVAKRIGKFSYWEPFYISDNKEPLFDERFSWEGQRNKRIQNYAMCLMDYEYHVLHPAFVVHSPGLKEFNNRSKEIKVRMKYVTTMGKLIHHKIKQEYMILYGKNRLCRV